MIVIGPAYATVYRCLNAAGEVIYVGVTSGLNARLGRHKKVSPWWSEVDVVRYGPFLPRPEAEDMETELIDLIQPKHNTNGRNGVPNNVRGSRTSQPAANPSPPGDAA